jgi:RHS repeat-associated protein
VRAVSNEAGTIIERHDYLPFGEECTTGGCAANLSLPSSQPRQFTGKERDAQTGMDYFGARYFSGERARFTTVDPVMPFASASVDPQLWNRYAYVHNNPLRFTDPDGRCFWDGCVAEGTTVYVVGAALVSAAAAVYATPEGRARTTQVMSDTGLIVTTGINAIKSWFLAEPPQLKAGKEAHRNEEVRPGEQAEVRTSSGTGRMDRYDADEAHIREIKPDNARGEKSGQRQLERYRKEMEDAMKRPIQPN